MQTTWNLIRALVGLIVAIFYHLPRLTFSLLLVSYYAAVDRQVNLTADPREHLKRARHILKKGLNAELPYAAVEIRFALERMVTHEIALCEAATKRMHDEYDPKKKINNLRRLSPDSATDHEIYLIDRQTGERLHWGSYKAMDAKKVVEIKGRIGALLHPKPGLRIGIADDPWYVETRTFLDTALTYLSRTYDNNTPFFTFHGVDDIEMVPKSN